VGSGRTIDWVANSSVSELYLSYRSLVAWEAKKELQTFSATRFASASEEKIIRDYINERENIQKE
jgi:hypothetical protein